MKERLQRQIAIRNIVAKNKVTGQEQLLMLLKHEGFNMTQATLSRDLKSLKIVKAPDPIGGYVYLLTNDIKSETTQRSGGGANYLADGFLSIEFSLNIAVIRTKPAYASSIAAIIDAANAYEIIGTIAGDDTIFLVTREGVEKGDVYVLLQRAMPNLKGRLF
ncbi:MAG TPA: hypothetical protein VJY41_05680 [Prolixibacteraceae bacterium]|nr:hypothetical protein [Prolixibacteraceae bacterium]